MGRVLTVPILRALGLIQSPPLTTPHTAIAIPMTPRKKLGLREVQRLA